MRTRRAGALLGAAMLTVVTAGCRDRGTVSAAAVTPGSAASTSAAVVRDQALARARVWIRPPAVPAAVDLSTNTPGPGAFDAGADVDCTFIVEPVGGSTPKFRCELPGGKHVKVKYGGPNGELPAEVAGTRLLAALGFPVDRMNRVHSVRCRGCPLLPQQALQCLARGGPAALCLHGANASTTVTFAPAVIEQPIAGSKIEAADGQGWSWYELEKIDPNAGGSPRSEVDALRLMAVLLAHWDNKGANQKLICPPDAEAPDGSCRAPIAAFGDLGSTFGPGKVDLGHWQRTAIWSDARACRVSMKTLPYGGATFPDTQISEAGRQFALRLLAPLTREQLDALFTSSGVTEFPHILAADRQPRAWTDVFLEKVHQIEEAGPCPVIESLIAHR